MMTKKVLTRKDILTAEDYNLTECEVPEFGGVVYLREISLRQRTEIMSNKDYMTQEKALIIAVCDAEGKPLFTADDAEKLSERNAKVVDRIINKWAQLNGMSKSSVSDAEKN